MKGKNNMKNKENGRSMVEMLGVLTVIALLSISGLYGYTRAMTKHKTNEVINSANKRAVMVAAQIAALGDSADEESLNAVWEDYDENGEYGTGEVSTGTSTSPNNRDYRVRRDKSAKEFSLVVPQMEKEICHEILNSIGKKVLKISISYTLLIFSLCPYLYLPLTNNNSLFILIREREDKIKL